MPTTTYAHYQMCSHIIKGGFITFFMIKKKPWKHELYAFQVLYNIYI